MRVSRRFPLLIAAPLVLALAGCGSNPYWGREAGDAIDSGPLGEATRRNAGIQSGEMNYVIDLQKRFAEEVPTTVNFAFDSAQLDQTARTILRQQASWIRQFPEVRFKVFGHTDAVGTNAYNKRLGMRRARAVVNYLVSQGVPRAHLKAVVSYGETQPVVVTQGREPRNRRTVTEVSGFVRSNPLVMDGKYAEIVYREYLTSAVPPSTLDQTLDTGGGGDGG